jgi:hypothetical protein
MALCSAGAVAGRRERRSASSDQPLASASVICPAANFAAAMARSKGQTALAGCGLATGNHVVQPFRAGKMRQICKRMPASCKRRHSERGSLSK